MGSDLLLILNEYGFAKAGSVLPAFALLFTALTGVLCLELCLLYPRSSNASLPSSLLKKDGRSSRKYLASDSNSCFGILHLFPHLNTAPYLCRLPLYFHSKAALSKRVMLSIYIRCFWMWNQKNGVSFFDSVGECENAINQWTRCSITKCIVESSYNQFIGFISPGDMGSSLS